MNPYMPYTPYMSQDAYMQDQMALRQRIDNLSQAQQSQCCCNTQKEILQSRYDAALQAQNMQAQMAQCLKRFFKAIRNLFTKKVNTVGTYA